MCVALLSFGCGNKPIPPPDPEGKDIVPGAIVAAEELGNGIRLYKVQHVDDYPKPMGPEYHMIAYEPKAKTFEEAREMWQDHKVKVVLDHIFVRGVNFLPRDHRVLMVEPVTEEELAPYKKSIVH